MILLEGDLPTVTSIAFFLTSTVIHSLSLPPLFSLSPLPLVAVGERQKEAQALPVPSLGHYLRSGG